MIQKMWIRFRQRMDLYLPSAEPISYRRPHSHGHRDWCVLDYPSTRE